MFGPRVTNLTAHWGIHVWVQIWYHERWLSRIDLVIVLAALDCGLDDLYCVLGQQLVGVLTRRHFCMIGYTN